MTHDTYTEAVALAREALRDHPRHAVPFPGYASTLGDIAAHLVARAAVRRKGWNTVKAVEHYVSAGRNAIDQLSLATNDPAPGASKAMFSGGLAGRVGRCWKLNQGYMNHYGETLLLSGTLPGLFKDLPLVEIDNDDMTLRYREALSREGLPDEIVTRSTVITGDNPHGQPDKRLWTIFHTPMKDRRLDHNPTMVDLPHNSTILVNSSMATYARQALILWQNLDRIRDMVESAEDIAIEAMSQVPGLIFERTTLYSVNTGRGPNLKDAVVLHMHYTGLSEGLREMPILAIMTGEIGLRRPTTSTIPGMLKPQKKRFEALRRLGHPTIDRTGRLFMEAARHVPDDLIDALKRNESQAETRLHAGYGTNAWFKISNGRVTASLEVAAGVHWKHDRLVVRRSFPETVVGTLPGRPATTIIDHPALEGATIRSARMKDGSLIIGIAPIWEKLE